MKEDETIEDRAKEYWNESGFQTKHQDSIIEYLVDFHKQEIQNPKECYNCSEKVEMISTGSMCPKCFCDQ